MDYKSIVKHKGDVVSAPTDDAVKAHIGSGNKTPTISKTINRLLI